MIAIFRPETPEPLTADERLFFAVLATIERMKSGFKNAQTAAATSAVLDRIESDLRAVLSWTPERREAAKAALTARGIKC